MKKLALFLISFAILLGSAKTSFAESDTLKRLKKQGYATVAVANEPPYSDIKTDGYVTGAAPDVARAVLNMLGVPDLKAEVIMYGAMIPALQARRVDMATSGLYIKPDRCESIIYSEPDLCGAEAFAVPVGNPNNLLTYEDIASPPDLKMVTCAGCAEEKYALERGVSADQIVYFDTPLSKAYFSSAHPAQVTIFKSGCAAMSSYVRRLFGLPTGTANASAPHKSGSE